MNEESPVLADGYELAAALTFQLTQCDGVLDATRERPARAGDVVITVASGLAEPELPDWVEASGLVAIHLGDHPMSRADGAVVRTLRGFRLFELGESPAQGEEAAPSTGSERNSSGL